MYFLNQHIILEALWNILLAISIPVVNKYFGKKSRFGQYVFYEYDSKLDTFLKEKGITSFKATEDILKLKNIEGISVIVDRKANYGAEYKNRKIVLGSKIAYEFSLRGVMTAAHEVVHAIQEKIDYQKYFSFFAFLLSFMVGIFDYKEWLIALIITDAIKYVFIFLAISFMMYTEIDATYKARELVLEYLKNFGIIDSEFVNKSTGNLLIWYSVNNIVTLIYLILACNAISFFVKLMLQ